jgi:hypothetical protein
MITREDLEGFPTSHLQEQAIAFAKAEADIDWLWHLLRLMPAGENEIGDLEESGMDIAATVSAINGYLRSDRNFADTLRPQYIDYILEHQ